MPERYSEPLEVLLGQVSENALIDIIFSKALGILGHTERFQPVRYLLHRGHRRPVVASTTVT
jgi:hypothetical protein